MAVMGDKRARASAKMLRVTQVRSAIGGTRRQRECLKGLGLKRIGSSVIVRDTPAVRGLIGRVSHLVALAE